MKYREVLIEQLKTMPFFSKEVISQLCGQYGIKEATIDSYIVRSLRYKDFFTLKRGLYISSDFYNKNKSDISYMFYLANVLRVPSYVSSWTALQYYNMTTEVIHSIISVTPKVTRSYATKIGTFAYQTIKKDLFCGFTLVKGGHDFFIASPPKALFDLLYFKTNQFRGITFETIDALIESMRIDSDEMNAADRATFYALVKKYTV
jgi:predicted transcriptional regulator of viral defense system